MVTGHYPKSYRDIIDVIDEMEQDIERLRVAVERNSAVAISRTRSYPPGWTGLRFRVLKRDRFTCRYCGRRAPEVTLHVDHVIPLVQGGRDHEDNLVAACADCNIGKGVKAA